MAGELLMGISQDERERAIAISRKKFQTDYASDMATSEDRGSRERALAIARNMMKRNRPIDEIIEDTGLTRKEVEKLSV